MKITVIAPGKIKENWLREGIEEYKKRLRRYCEVDIIEVSDSPDSLPEETVKKQEGERILQKIKDKDRVVLLDLGGVKLESVSFSRSLSENFLEGGAEIIFVIGGSLGVSAEVKKRANQMLCLSTMTFTHQMARLLLLEQCYRAFRIERGEPYHK